VSKRTIGVVSARWKWIAAASLAAIGFWALVHLLPSVADWPMGGQDGNPVPGPPRDTALLLGALMLVPWAALTTFLFVRARAVLIGILITLGTAIPMVAAMYLSDSWCPNIYDLDNCHGTTVITGLMVVPPIIGTALFGIVFGRRRGLRLSSGASAALAVIVITSFIYLPTAAASSPVDGDDFFMYYWLWPFVALLLMVFLALPAAIGVIIGSTWKQPRPAVPGRAAEA
jgi:hypothetical protein